MALWFCRISTELSRTLAFALCLESAKPCIVSDEHRSRRKLVIQLWVSERVNCGACLLGDTESVSWFVHRGLDNLIFSHFCFEFVTSFSLNWIGWILIKTVPICTLIGSRGQEQTQHSLEWLPPVYSQSENIKSISWLNTECRHDLFPFWSRVCYLFRVKLNQGRNQSSNFL